MIPAPTTQVAQKLGLGTGASYPYSHMPPWQAKEGQPARMAMTQSYSVGATAGRAGQFPVVLYPILKAGLRDMWDSISWDPLACFRMNKGRLGEPAWASCQGRGWGRCPAPGFPAALTGAGHWAGIVTHSGPGGEPALQSGATQLSLCPPPVQEGQLGGFGGVPTLPVESGPLPTPTPTLGSSQPTWLPV